MYIQAYIFDKWLLFLIPQIVYPLFSGIFSENTNNSNIYLGKLGREM